MRESVEAPPAAVHGKHPRRCGADTRFRCTGPRFSCVAALPLVFAVLLSSATAYGDESGDTALTVPGMILTGVGAGALAAVGTPVVVGGVARMAGEDAGGLSLGRGADAVPIPVVFVGGLLALGVGIPLWSAGTPREPKYVDQDGIARPVRTYHDPGMRKVGIVLAASGLGLAGIAVAMSYLPGNCDDSNPPACTYPFRDAAVPVGLLGLTAAGTGIGLWVTGGHKVRATDAPRISLMATTTGVVARADF